MKATSPVPRDINPIFNDVLAFEGLCLGESLHFRLKDSGLLKSEHLGGLLGPRVLAMGVLLVGQDFSGFLELAMTQEIHKNAPPPMLHIRVNFCRDAEDGVPPSGHTAATVDAWTTWPSAPVLEDSGVPACAASCEATPAAKAIRLEAQPQSSCFGPAASSSSEAPPAVQAIKFEAQPQSLCSVVPAAGSSCGVPGSVVPASSVASEATQRCSIFHIGEEVYSLVLPNLILSELVNMQGTRRRHLFPNGALRNYNVLGAGFDTTRDNHFCDSARC